jgi:hypothetical protein
MNARKLDKAVQLDLDAGWHGLTCGRALDHQHGHGESAVMIVS